MADKIFDQLFDNALKEEPQGSHTPIFVVYERETFKVNKIWEEHPPAQEIPEGHEVTKIYRSTHIFAGADFWFEFIQSWMNKRR
jgi:hypothetical protein